MTNEDQECEKKQLLALKAVEDIKAGLTTVSRRLTGLEDFQADQLKINDAMKVTVAKNSETMTKVEAFMVKTEKEVFGPLKTAKSYRDKFKNYCMYFVICLIVTAPLALSNQQIFDLAMKLIK